MNRTRIGRNTNVATRQVVYRTPVGIEVDELDHFEIVRRRVFYDDVLLVTLHRRPAWGWVVFLGILLLSFGTIAIAATNVWFAVAAAAALIVGIIRMLVPVDVVTVFGRRSKAAVCFPWRKGYARRIYNEICANAAGAQGKLAGEIARNEPAAEEPASEMPPMPAPDAG